MSKRNYNAVAAILKRYKELGTLTPLMVEGLIKELAEHFNYDNELFKYDKFLTACGIEQE